MERVAKRFLLHNKRERDEVKESDFDELKQDIQMVRHELNNDVGIFSRNLINCSAMLHRGISLIGDFFLQKSQDAASQSEINERLKVFQSLNAHFLNELSDEVSVRSSDSLNRYSNRSIGSRFDDEDEDE